MIKKLQDIKAMGIGISLDDFGTGYSSLNNLMYLPLSYVKIDKSILWKSMENHKVNSLIKSVISYASSMDIEVVVEGIENTEMIEKVIELKGDYGQGFFYYKPMSSDNIETLIYQENINESPTNP